MKRIPPPGNGSLFDHPSTEEHPGEPEIHVDAPSTPPADEHLSREEPIEREIPPAMVHVNVHQPPVPSPQPIHAVPSAGPDPLSLALAAKDKELQNANAEIERLRSLISSMPEPSTVAASEFTSSSELRRRSPRSVFSDDDDGASTLSPATEVGSYVEDTMHPPEGVPLQVVIIIALGVFVTTYLFF